MTVSTTSTTTTYTGNGVTTTFATDFQFLLGTDLVVTVDGVTKNLNSNYTVTGGDGSSGSVVFLAAPADVTTIIINRLVPLTQLVDYQPNDAFDAESHEQALDKLTQIEQQQQSAIERAFRVGPLEAEVAAISGDIGSKYLYLNAAKQLIAVTGDPSQPITHTTEYHYPTVGETVVPVSAYTQGSGDLAVFVNGVLQVLTVDYAETSNASVTMVTPLADGDVVILSIGDVFSVTLVSPGVSEESITGITTSTLTLTTMTYQPGVDNVWVFFNGSKLSSTDYTETNSTTITLGFTPVSADVFDVAIGQSLDVVTSGSFNLTSTQSVSPFANVFIRYREPSGITKGYVGYTSSSTNVFAIDSLEDAAVSVRTGTPGDPSTSIQRGFFYGDSTSSYLAVCSPDTTGGTFIRFTENNGTTIKGHVGYTSITDDDLRIINFEVNANIQFGINGTGQIIMPFAVGSAAAPKLAVTGDLDTGFYSAAANTLNVTVAGVLKQTWEALKTTFSNYLVVTGLITSTVTTFASADASPTVLGLNLFKTTGTTAITDFDDGVVGQTIKILANANITITHNASIIILNGAVNYAMTANDTLTLTMFNDQVWVEVARSVN